MANAKQVKRESVKHANASKKANLAYTNLSAEGKRRVNAIVKAGKLIGTARETIAKMMSEQFPTLREYKRYESNKTFFSAIREESNNGTAYTYALAWAKEKFGGPLRKDGSIGGSDGSGMTFGRWANAWDMKLESVVEYAAKIPKADIEPEAYARIMELIETIVNAQVEFKAYTDAEKLAAETAESVPDKVAA
jgi:hypothetical protein